MSGTSPPGSNCGTGSRTYASRSRRRRRSRYPCRSRASSATITSRAWRAAGRTSTGPRWPASQRRTQGCERGSPPRDRGNDGHLVTILNRRGEPAAEPDVLVVQIEDHERVRIAVLVAEARSERGVTRRHIRDGLAERATAGGQRANAARVGREHRGKVQRDGHGTV